MRYEEFLCYIRDGVSIKLREKIADELDILLYKTIKNNDVELDGLSISAHNESVSRIIYLNDYYDDYLKGRTSEDIIEDICSVYMEYSCRFEFDSESFKQYSNVRKKILYKLINREMNKEYLKTMPHIPFLDLAIVFYCYVGDCSRGEAVIMINNEYTGMWEADADMLLKEAAANTPHMLPAEVACLDAVTVCECVDLNECYTSDFSVESLRLLSGGDKFLPLSGKMGKCMYVLTNSLKSYGAATILYDGIISKLSDAFNANLYILPSSVHEVILMPDTGDIDRTELSNMVLNVNKSSVAYEDILGDRVYYYNREDKTIHF